MCFEFYAKRPAYVCYEFPTNKECYIRPGYVCYEFTPSLRGFEFPSTDKPFQHVQCMCDFLHFKYSHSWYSYLHTVGIHIYIRLAFLFTCFRHSYLFTRLAFVFIYVWHSYLPHTVDILVYTRLVFYLHTVGFRIYTCLAFVITHGWHLYLHRVGIRIYTRLAFVSTHGWHSYLHTKYCIHRQLVCVVHAYKKTSLVSC